VSLGRRVSIAVMPWASRGMAKATAKALSFSLRAPPGTDDSLAAAILQICALTPARRCLADLLMGDSGRRRSGRGRDCDPPASVSALRWPGAFQVAEVALQPLVVVGAFGLVDLPGHRPQGVERGPAGAGGAVAGAGAVELGALHAGVGRHVFRRAHQGVPAVRPLSR
jgi:hypothetical protein